MKPEMELVLEKIREMEDEEDLLIEHESWGAAEHANARKCHLIDELKRLLTPAQQDAMDQVQAKAFLAYLAGGSQGKYPSVLDSIRQIIE